MSIHFSSNQTGSVLLLLFIILFTLIIPMFELVSNLEGFDDTDIPSIKTLQKLFDVMIQDNNFIPSDKSIEMLSKRINIIKDNYLSDNYKLLNSIDKEYISNLLNNYLENMQAKLQLFNSILNVETNLATQIKNITDKIKNPRPSPTDQEYISNLFNGYLENIRENLKIAKKSDDNRLNRQTIIKQIKEKINTVLQTTQSSNSNTIIK